MSAHLRVNFFLLTLTVLLCSVLYPLAVWGIGQTLFHEQAEGSLLTDGQGRPIGSQLIAQPFTADQYFQPRPSAVSYNAAASGASNWAASNCLLRDRVASQLGPIVKYRSGPKKGQPVGPDVEHWFRQEESSGKPRILAQWAALHPTLAQNAGQSDKPLSSAEIQSRFFDMWLQEHPAVDLESVPADMVMASGSGLDPDITLNNALWQLNRVAASWAKNTGRQQADVRREIEQLLRQSSRAPLGGLVGVPLVNVLEVNVALQRRYSTATRGAR
jgi:potassium-transporting ATPase KdpC subunit